MRRTFLASLCVLALLADGCGGASSTNLGANGDQGGASGSSAGGAPAAGGAGGTTASPCGTPCVATPECGAGFECVQVAEDSYCAPVCTDQAACNGGVCCTIPSVEGNQADVCLLAGAACGGDVCSRVTGQGGSNGGQGGGGQAGSSSGKCGNLDGPTLTAACKACPAGGTKNGAPCQANGCYGGWYCNAQTNKCQAPPASCPGSTQGGGGSPTAGAGGSSAHGGSPPGGGGSPAMGSIGPNGGTLDKLQFAIVGDTRPPVPDDTKGYPTAVITQIWQGVQALNPPFAVTTGDYMFAKPGNGQAMPQMQMYLQARSNFKNITFPVLGNHECTSATNSNCGPGNSSGMPENYQVFLSQMMAPLGQTNPYYEVDIAGTSGWTAKFLMVAVNAWDSGQASWLTQALQKPTTYTFVVRHESWTVSGPAGVPGCNSILSGANYTLLIAGHAHTYKQDPAHKQVIIGNGGAPIVGNVNYGWVIATQRADSAIQFDLYDYSTSAVVQSFAVNPDGSPAP